jgi:hypothetical protein
MADLPTMMPAKRKDTVSQLRFDGPGSLVIMYEVLPDGKEQYVLGNGKRVRCVCELSDLKDILWELEERSK